MLRLKQNNVLLKYWTNTHCRGKVLRHWGPCIVLVEMWRFWLKVFLACLPIHLKKWPETNINQIKYEKEKKMKCKQCR
jgi:hypothetical protein